MSRSLEEFKRFSARYILESVHKYFPGYESSSVVNIVDNILHEFSYQCLCIVELVAMIQVVYIYWTACLRD